MARFVGRAGELRQLDHELTRVRQVTEEPGRCVLVRGRRRVGKSRLIERFCDGARVPYAFFTASQQGHGEVGLFAEAVLESSLPGRALFADAQPTSWDSALRLLAAALDDHLPSVVVIDEFPYLVADDPSVEATFQKQWDRLLSKKSVLLVLVGSDLAMMEALNTHGRAFFQRGTEMIVAPLSPAETGEIVGAPSAVDSFDAYLVTGGLPLVCGAWPPGVTMWEYLADALAQSTSPIIVSGERTLSAEFPSHVQARAVLGQIGSGETTFSNIARATGGIQAATLNRALEMLQAKRVVRREVPLSTKPSREARYRVADPYLRFWLRFVGPHLAEIERGRSDRVMARLRRDWTTWRGRAIEPIVRDALARLAPISGLPPADVVGGFWTRSNSPEIDIIGGDRGPVAKQIAYAGTIKWLEDRPLDQADLNRLTADVLHVPGADRSTPLLAVSRSGVTARGAAAILGPDDLLAAWT
jgi:AAA+ ATPase superfamily predicted ATPase